MNGDDPLRRALADGDHACPDGRALVRLGALVRDAGRVPAHDLIVAVRDRLGDANDSCDAAIDARYDADPAAGRDPALDRLAAAVAGVRPPRPVDLVAGVRKRLRSGASTRQDAVQRAQRSRRWRIVGMVLAGHVAAALVIAALRVGVHDAAPAAGDGAIAVTQVAEPAAPAGSDWARRAARRDDLLVVRRAPELLARIRGDHGAQAAALHAPRLAAALVAAQEADGRIGPASGDADRDAAIQALAALALSGEGLGDARRTAALRRSLAWLDANPAAAPLPAALAAAAQCDGLLLLRDPLLREPAQRALDRLAAQPVQPGLAGLGGHALLAAELGRLAGLQVQGRWLHDLRRAAMRAATGDDDGRRGLAAWARLSQGRDDAATRALHDHLRQDLPAAAPAADALAWIMGGLAAGEDPATAQAWNAALTRAVPAPAATGLVPAARVRYAETAGPAGDVLATAATALALQATTRFAVP